jgi:hypothetical protein
LHVSGASPAALFEGNVRIIGDLIAENYVVSSSVLHITSSQLSGSTVFGNTPDDTHQFTGSLLFGTSSISCGHITSSGNISGSATSTGSFGVYGNNFVPSTDDAYTLGSTSHRFSDLYATQTTIGGIFEVGLRTEGIGKFVTGTIVVWRDNKLVACDNDSDPFVMGVTKNGKDEPIVIGAEPVLVTGKVDVGDFIVTSKKNGHGKAVKRGYLLKKDLFGKVIAQALESGDGDSYLVKCMIRKM